MALAGKVIRGKITLYRNDVEVRTFDYKSILERKKIIENFLAAIKKLTNGLYYYTIIPEEVRSRWKRKYKPVDGIGNSDYGIVNTVQTQRRLISDKR